MSQQCECDIDCNNCEGQPEKLQIQLFHYKQRFSWDCGISCVLMVLPKKHRTHLINNFANICKLEGFNKSTWTIDLSYLLNKYNVNHLFCTVTLGVHPGYKNRNIKFYEQILTKDESRVNQRFLTAEENGIKVKRCSVTLKNIIDRLVNGPVIVLTNANLLSCDICKLNKISSELRKCLPFPMTYQGHYIVLCGYDIKFRKIYYRNPSFADRVCAMSLESLENARKSYGTDEDIIFINN